LAYAHQGNYSRAIEDYNQAININPGLADAFRNRSIAYRRKGDFLRAMADRVHLVRLKFGVIGIVVRLCSLVLIVLFILVFNFKRFRKHP
jgi:hypothetical protein